VADNRVQFAFADELFFMTEKLQKVKEKIENEKKSHNSQIHKAISISNHP